MTTVVRRKFRVSRLMRESLWGSPKDAVHKRNYGPGQHGRNPTRKMSDFYKQNAAQRAFRTYYAMGKKQFVNLFYQAYRAKGNASDNLISLLERRLSAVLYRSGLAPTIFAAKQLISHKHVTVNNEVVNIASYTVNEGDIIQIREKALRIPCIANLSREVDAPHYLEVNKDKKTVKLLLPNIKLADVPYAVVMDPKSVVEYLSRRV